MQHFEQHASSRLLFAASLLQRKQEMGPAGTYLVELARSGRSTCQTCKEQIDHVSSTQGCAARSPGT
jgi:hypothetical protein